MRKTCCFSAAFAGAGLVGALFSAICMVLTLAALPNGAVQNEVKLLSRDAVTTADELMGRYLRGNVTAAIDLGGLGTDYVRFVPETLFLNFSTLSQLIDQFRFAVEIDFGPLAGELVGRIPRLSASSASFSIAIGTTRDKFSGVFNSKSVQKFGEIFNRDQREGLAASLIDGFSVVVQNVSDI